jgi:hypothetical protein
VAVGNSCGTYLAPARRMIRATFACTDPHQCASQPSPFKEPADAPVSSGAWFAPTSNRHRDCRRRNPPDPAPASFPSRGRQGRRRARPLQGGRIYRPNRLGRSAAQARGPALCTLSRTSGQVPAFSSFSEILVFGTTLRVGSRSSPGVRWNHSGAAREALAVRPRDEWARFRP